MIHGFIADRGEFDIESTVFPLSFSSGGCFNKVHCEPNWRWKPIHPLSDYDLWYVVAGSGIMRINGEQYPIKRGTCFIIRPGDYPEAEQDPEDRVSVIFIHFDVSAPFAKDFMDAIPRCNEIKDQIRFEMLLHMLLEEEELQQGWKTEAFDSWMKLLWYQLLRNQSHEGEDAKVSEGQKLKIYKLMTVIRSQCNQEGSIDYARLASFSGWSQDYMNSLFKKYTGVSIKQYITRTKLERAAQLLMHTEMSITQIACTLGYSDPYIFSRLFKKYFSMSPAAMRKRAYPTSNG